MKQITINIKTYLENDAVNTGLKNLYDTNPSYEAQETSMSEAYEGYLDIQSMLLESIDKGIFEETPFARRNAISSSLQQIQRYYNNVAQFITHYNSLNDQVQLTNIPKRLTEDLNIEIESKAITSLRRKYKKIVQDLEDSEEIKNAINKFKEDSEKFLLEIESVSTKSSDFNEKIDETKKEIETTQSNIQESEQEIENRKKEILAFANNVEKSENKINNIETELNDSIKNSINSNILKAKELIKQAEEALELKQTEGISKAYSSRLDKLTSEKTKKNWLLGSITFILITFFIGYLLTGGKVNLWGFIIEFSATDSIAFVVGRILLTGIGISGAVFCANRYVYLKNLEEDYEYKVVLSKSILAFSNKIKELDKDKVAEYLTKVLSELHQDPLRDRKSNKNKEIDLNSINQFSEILSKWKEMN
jgi:hypothetical protein